MGVLKRAVLFSAGGLCYVGLELLWRGYSHSSMFVAGGSCFMLLGRLRHCGPVLKALGGAGIITAVELVTGLLVNRKYQVWDYRELPFNYRGQICLPYSLLWVPVALAGGLLYGFLDWVICTKIVKNKGKIM